MSGTITGIVLNQNTITTDAPVGTEVGTVTVTLSDNTAFSGALTLAGPYASYFSLIAVRDPYSITSIALDNLTVAFGAPSGTKVGTVVVRLSDGTAFSGTLAVDDTAHFIVSNFDLQTVGTLTGGTVYPVTVTASDPNSSNLLLATNVQIGAQAGGAVPGPLTQVTSPFQDASSITVNWAPPITGGVMDAGVHQIQYKAHSSGIWLNATSVPYITPSVGSLTDAAGNTWTINAAGKPVINATNIDQPSTVKIIYKISNTLWQLDLSNNWYSTIGGIAPAWAGPFTVSPLSLTISGLTASTPYDLQGFATNVAGTGAASTPPVQTTTQAATQTGGTGPTASSAFMTVDFTSARNYTNGGTGQQIVDRRMWGVSTGGAADTSYGVFGNASFRTAAATVNPGLWRVNGDQVGRSDSRFWNSDGTVHTQTFDNLINFFPQVDPLGISSVIIGANTPVTNTYPGVTDVTSYGNAMQRLATYLNSAVMPNGQKLPIIGFECANEPDGHLSLSELTSYYNAMCTAVRSVNPNFLCCGPTVSTAGAYGPSFQQQTTRLDVFDWHLYIGGSPNIPASPRYTSTRGTGDMQGAIGNVNLSSISAFFLGEYNIDWNCADGAQRTYEGAVFDARILLDELDQCPRPFWAGIWDAYADGTCGIIGLNSFTICPGGYLLGAGVRTIYGPRWNVPTNGSGLMTCAVTPPGAHFGVMVVNPGFGSKSGQVALSHWPVNSTGNGVANMWQINSGTTGDGTRTTTQVTAGLTASINFPDPSITIISI